MLKVTLIPAFTDNYIYLLQDSQTQEYGLVDPGDSNVILPYLEQHKITPKLILLTHHHPDHVAAVSDIVEQYGSMVYGPAAEKKKLPRLDFSLEENDRLFLGMERAEIIVTPGHTLGHICYHFAQSKKIFVGDTLFAGGCGRLFEGTPQQMWDSLKKLRDLPPETEIYCGHEYTQANYHFVESLWQSPPLEVQRRIQEVTELRAKGLPTIPTNIAQEIATNPFLQADRPDLLTELGLQNASPDHAFAEIRQRKDQF